MDNIPIRKSPSLNEVNQHLDVPSAVMDQLQRDAAKASTPHQPIDDTPYEEFELPSKGYFYPNESPLSSGKIKIKYMTAKEEDILSSETLIKKGVVLDVLLDTLIVTPNIKTDDLLITDKNAVFVYARKLAYGDEYDIDIKCPECGVESKVTIDLNLVKNSEFDFSQFHRGVNEFEYKLPISKKVIKYKLLTGLDERMISEEVKGVSKIDKSGKVPELTTRLKKMILSVDNNSDRTFVRKFVDSMMSKDSLALRKHLTQATPVMDLRFDFECPHCGHSEFMRIPIGVSFFWPES